MAKITRKEPDGPLRSSLRQSSEALGDENGGRVFAGAYDLANTGLEAVLALESHHLGDSDKSIPAPFKRVKIERDRGQYTDGHTAATQEIPATYRM